MRIKIGDKTIMRLPDRLPGLKAFDINFNPSAVAQTDGGVPDVDRPRRINWAQESGPPDQSSIVSACLFWLMRKFPESPLILKELVNDGPPETIRIDPFLELVRSPNPWYGGNTLWQATIADYSIDGNAYWAKIRSEAGNVVQLWWIPSFQMEPRGSRIDPTVFIDHYEQTIMGRKILWDPMDIIHFRFGIDPRNQRKGVSQLKSLFREIFTDNEGAEFTGGLLRNMGVPGIIFIPDTEAGLTPKQQKETEDSLRRKLHGQNRGLPLVASGKSRIEQFGFDPSQMDLAKLRHIPEERVTAIFGIPASIVGLGTGLEQTKVGATQQEARRMGHENAVQPAQRSTTDTLDRQLLPEFKGSESKRFMSEFDNSKIAALQEDQTQVVGRLNTGVQGGWTTVGEARAAQGLPVTDADAIYLRSFNQIEIPAGESAADPLPALPAADGEPAPTLIPGSADVDVQRLALNGAQVTALQSIIEQVTNGQLSPESAKALIRAAFPTITDGAIDRMVDGAAAFTPKEPEDPKTRKLRELVDG